MRAERVLDSGFEQAQPMGGNLDIVETLERAGEGVRHAARRVEDVHVHHRASPAGQCGEVGFDDEVEIVEIRAATLDAAVDHPQSRLPYRRS